MLIKLFAELRSLWYRTEVPDFLLSIAWVFLSVLVADLGAFGLSTMVTHCSRSEGDSLQPAAI